MVDRIEIDKRNGIVLCSWLYDGRVEKVRVIKTNNIIYVCEECEGIWETVDDFLNNTMTPQATVEGYLKALGLELSRRKNRIDWDEYIHSEGFLHIDELKQLLPSTIKIVEI